MTSGHVQWRACRNQESHMNHIVEIRELSKVYERGRQKVEVLHHVDLDIGQGDFIALMGPSGSGKTTLLNLIGGLDSPTQGSLSVAGQRIDRMSEGALAKWRSEHVGFVFQFYNLIPSLTARENVALVTEIADDPMRPEEALALVGLEHRLDHFPSQMSGGEQQRVAIARAVAKRPQVLLCDEPTGALDVHTGVMVLDVIARVNRELGTTTVVITHNAVIAGMADRVVHFGDGQVARIERNAVRQPASGLSW